MKSQSMADWLAGCVLTLFSVRHMQIRLFVNFAHIHTAASAKGINKGLIVSNNRRNTFDERRMRKKGTRVNCVS